MKFIKTKFFIFLFVIVTISFFIIENAAAKNLKFGISTIYLPKQYNGMATNRIIPIDIFIPKGKIKATILVLPGWNFSRKRWYKETRLLSFAEKNGFCCIFPEMGKTNYESKYFKESRKRPLWQKITGGQWIKKIFIPYMQKKYSLLNKKNKNFLLGLSTGGRGVALLSLQNPNLFVGGAALSGDFNQVEMPRDALMTGAYGRFSRFHTRWATVDNPTIAAIYGKWRMPIYIAHGKSDKTSPFIQSKMFYDTLKKYYPFLKVRFNPVPRAGHNFKFWNGELPNIFKFFNEILGR